MENKLCAARNGVLDIMKGLGILLVIVGHSTITKMPHDVIYTFHMPLFFVVAGFLYKEKPMDGKWWRNNFYRLLVPYLIFGIIWILYDLVQGHVNGFTIADVKGDLLALVWSNSGPHANAYLGSISKGVGAAWFFFALFWCRVLFAFAERNIKKKLLPVVILLVSFASYILLSHVVLPFAILQGALSLVFYYLGYLLRLLIVELNEKNVITAVIKHQWVGFSVMLVLLIWFKCIRHSHIILAYGYFGQWEMDVIGSLGGIFIVYLVSLLFFRYGYKVKDVLEFIGRNSMTLFVVHSVEFQMHVFYNYQSATATGGGGQVLIRLAVDFSVMCVCLLVDKGILKLVHKT